MNIKRTYYISGAVEEALNLNKPPIPFDGYFERFIKFEIEGMDERYCDGKAILYANDLCEDAKWKYTSLIETADYPDKYLPDYLKRLYYFGEDKSVWAVLPCKMKFIRLGFIDTTPEEYLDKIRPKKETYPELWILFALVFIAAMFA